MVFLFLKEKRLFFKGLLFYKSSVKCFAIPSPDLQKLNDRIKQAYGQIGCTDPVEYEAVYDVTRIVAH
jgi:hypothetical protein